MNKFKVLTLGAVLLTAVSCSKSPANEAHQKFVNMCQEDPRSKNQGFDCNCQADIIQAVLKEDEMTLLVNFLDVEKADRNKAIELAKDPKYMPVFQKIGGIGLAIHDKCGKTTAQAAASTPAPAESAPASAAPEASAPASAPAASEAAPASAPAAQ